MFKEKASLMYNIQLAHKDNFVLEKLSLRLFLTGLSGKIKPLESINLTLLACPNVYN